MHVELPLIISLFLPTSIFIMNENRGAWPQEERKDRVRAGGSRLCERVQLYACAEIDRNGKAKILPVSVENRVYIVACVVGKCEETVCVHFNEKITVRWHISFRSCPFLPVYIGCP